MEPLEAINNDKRHVPAFTSEDGTYQEDEFRNFRIIVKGVESDWKDLYDGIAHLEVDGELYIGVSSFWGNTIPSRCALKVQKVDEEGEEGFYKYRFTDRIIDEIIGPKDLEDILRDPIAENQDYGFIAKDTKIKDFIKLRITDLSTGKSLNREEVNEYIYEAFSSIEFDVIDEKGKKINIKKEEKRRETDEVI